ncbi:MAG: hypothetical protein WCL24_07940 [Verrucomicrobiota bacterium]
MKNLPFFASLAALAAFAFSSTPAVAGSLFFGLSLAAIFSADYLRVIKPLAPQADLVAFTREAPSLPTCARAA